MDRWKAEQGRGREKRKIRRKKSEKKEDADVRKGRKVVKHFVFPMIWGSGGSKSRLAKAASAEPAGQLDHFWRFRCRKSGTPLWRKAHFEVKMLKTPGVRTTFGGSDVEKVHAVVARSTFRSQNVKNTRGSDHFWRFRCRFASLHYRTLHYTTLQYTTLRYTTLQYTPLH